MRTLIVGNAKTGTTALLYLIAQASGAARVYMEEPAASLRELPQDCVAKIIFEHESESALRDAAAQFDHKILLLRDPRDTLLSQLLFKIKAEPALLADDAFLGTLLGMLQAKQAAPQSHDLVALARLFPADAPGVLETARERLARFAAFVARCQGAWQVVYYEDLVAGNLRGLQRTLGLSLGRPAALPQEYAHVARSKTSGDWAHWFTANDVAALRPAFGPLLEAFGYDDVWTRAETPAIAPAHAHDYLLALIQARRALQGLPAYRARAAAASAPAPSCNICGGSDFGPGPGGRRAETGAQPCCQQCGALERQRIVRAMFLALPLGFLDWRRGLQFSTDPAVCSEQFRSFEVSEYGGQNSLDIQAIDRADGSYDFISLNHVLEFVPDDRKGFAELARLLSPRGMIQATLSSPLLRQACVDYATPFGPHAAWHLYACDVRERFDCARHALTMLAIEGADPCTGAREVVHFFLKDKDDAARITTWLQMSLPDARQVE